jgi:hypothetical protein
MTVLRWQWTLANRGQVEAALDPATNEETVAQGAKVLSRSARGDRPNGHVVVVAAGELEGASERPPIEAVVTFAPTAPVCVLRVDGEEVAPTRWPTRERTGGATAPPAPRPWLRYFFVALGIAMMVMSGVLISRAGREPRRDPRNTALDVTYRAPSGRFVAHFPKDLEPRPALLPGDASGVVLEDRGKAMALVVLAAPLDPSAPRDPWTLQQRFHAEAIANLTKGAAAYEEGARREETCNGQPGAVTTGSLMLRDTKLARIRACAFVADDTGYLVLSSLSEPASKEDERLLRSIVDAVEATHLAPIAPSSRSGL